MGDSVPDSNTDRDVEPEAIKVKVHLSSNQVNGH